MAKIVTFGELMLRLAPYNFEKLVQVGTLQATYGGGEANVAISTANFGHETWFVSLLPKNDLGDAAENTMRRFGVNPEYIIRTGDRLGIYFLEHGASIRPSKVIYDRANSAIAKVKSGDIDWIKVFRGKDWFHFTGITPALGPNVAAVTLEALEAARAANVKISCDLNYRKKLWTREEARITMTKLVQFVDVIIANEEDASDVFGINAATTDVRSGKLDIDHYKSTARQLMDLSGCEKVAITLRESLSASDNNWWAMLYDGKEISLSKKYSIHLVDRVGGGDSFGAGLIHGLLQGWGNQQSLEFAVAASALKQTIPGDINLVKEDEVMNLVQGDASGRIKR
ncbi:MAG: sugar kinase [Candidatus Marinimicrobia bacterium]|nr:sugar kinase [Candidatus Neomarinimicrobiota bacterium]